MDPVHWSRDLQVQNSVKFSLKLGLTALFTYLKIILLQFFQFSAIKGIQIDPDSISLGYTHLHIINFVEILIKKKKKNYV